MNKSSKNIFCTTNSGLLIFCLLINFCVMNSANANVSSPQDHQILNDGFETGTLDPRLLIDSVGTYASLPGIKPITNFGSTMAFDFGRCTSFNCNTTLRFTLPTQTFISYIRFKEIVLGNFTWEGRVFLDGTYLPNGNFGRAFLGNDTMFRTRKFLINRFVRTIELRGPVNASSSEIYIDDLLITTKADDIKSDFDGDFKTDISIFRPSNGQWGYKQSSDDTVKAFTFGLSIDRIVPADYDGDGKTDLAFWRPLTGQWFVFRSTNFTFFAAPFGEGTDIPAPGDFDGDGKADLAVYRGSQGTWYILKSTGGVQITSFGAGGDVPVVADYDGDGKADIAIWRPSVGEWWFQRSSDGVVSALQFGSNADKPVPGDYTGDGKADIAFFRSSTGFWFILRSEDLSFFSIPFGANGDIPVPGDYDGDGKADTAVFRPSSSTWFVNRTTAGILITNFGTTDDQPVPASFVP